MAIKPTDLSLEEQRVLSELAAKSQDKALRVAVSASLERSAKKPESNRVPRSEQERE